MYGLIKKNTSQYILFPLVDADGDYVTGATITGTFNYWEDGTAPQTSFGALTNAEVEIGSTGIYRVLLTAGETNHGYIAVQFTSGTSKPQLLEFRTTVADPLNLATTTSGVTIDVESGGTVGIDFNNVNGTHPVVSISGTIDTLDALDTALDSAHGAGSWATATGFSAPNEYDTVIAALQTDLDNPNQYKATGFSTHAAADIWSVGTRQLSGTISDFDELDTALDAAHGAGSWLSATGFSTHSAADVWTTGSRELSTPNNYKATGFSTHDAAAIWAVGTREITGGTISTISDKTGYSISGTITTFDALDTALDSAHGAGSWLTGGAGGATIQTIPSIPKNIDVSGTKLVRIALYVNDQNDDLPTTAEITPGTITIKRSADGGTSWSTIVNAEACLEHAGCIYYDEVFDSGAGYASADMIEITFKGQIVTISANDHIITDSTNGMVFTTRMDSGLSGGGPSAGDIADAVWEEAIVDHSTSSTFGGKNQLVVPSETLADYKATGFSTHSQADVWTTGSRELSTPANYKATGFSTHAAADIWSVGTRTITGGALTTPNDYKATGFSTHAAADIWSVGTREITGGTISTVGDKTGYSISGTKQTLDALNDITAAGVWSETGRELSTPNSYKADVSGLATSSALATHVTALATHVTALATHDTDIKAETLRLRGLNGEYLVAEFGFDLEDNITIEFWQYDNESNFNTHNKSTGMIGSWIINTLYTYGKPTTAKSKKLT